MTNEQKAELIKLLKELLYNAEDSTIIQQELSYKLKKELQKELKSYER